MADIGAKIELQGEQVFRDALAQINTSLKVTASELKLVSARYTDNATSIEALNSKQTVLNKSFDEQNKKVDKLREALRNATLKYGEADTKTQKWQIALNNAEAELIKLDKELTTNQGKIDEYNKNADNAAKSTGTLGDKLNDVISKFGIELPKGAQNAIAALNKVSGSTLALVGASVSVVAGFSKTTIETAKTAKEILNLSKTTGMTTDSYQKWDYVLKSVGYSMEQAQGDLSQLAEKAMDAANNTGEGAELFGKLGIKVKEYNGTLKTQEQLFGEVITKLQSMKDVTERNAIASALMSTTGEKLVPILNMTAKELDNTKNKAQEMGYVMSGNTLDSFGQLDNAMQKLNNQSTAFKNTIALAMLPVLTGLFEMLNKIDPKVLATVAIIGSIALVAVTVVKSIGSVISIFSAMNPATLKTTAIIVGVTAALIALAAIIAVIMGQGDQLNRTMSNIGNSVGQMTNSVNGAGQRIGYNAMGTNNWRGGLTWVGEQGPELVDLPTGSKVFSNRTSRQIASGGNAESGTVNNYYLQVKAEDINDVVKMKNTFTNLKQTSRAGVVKMA